MSLAFQVLSGASVESVVPDLARLRVTVFRDWPYLYEGSLDYERKYLAKYVKLPRATIVIAKDGDAIVGASTALPLTDSEAELQKPFVDAGIDPAQVYYYGESVLLAEYRGQGAGVRFFVEREKRARDLGFNLATFCGVVRPTDHPARPADYVPLDAFWTKRGFKPRPDLTASFEWLDLGDTAPTHKPMAFWTKDLAKA